MDVIEELIERRRISKEELEKYRAIGTITREEGLWVEKLAEKIGELDGLVMFHPPLDHVRLDPYIRKKVAELKEILPKIRTEWKKKD